MELKGVVDRRRVARGSKSEHFAVVLRTASGVFKLRRRGGHAFRDPMLERLVGQRLRAEGSLHGTTFIADRLEPQTASASPERHAAQQRRPVRAPWRKTPESRGRRSRSRATVAPKLATRAADAAPDPFRHVVLLMLENRSFDHMLGALEAVVPELDGVAPAGAARLNRDAAGTVFEQRPGAAAIVDPDPSHDTTNVLNQIAGGNGGFVTDYEHSHRGKVNDAQKQAVMAYHTLDSLWALHQLGRAFAMCDGWFCSVPGPTWTNRLFAMSGTSQGRVKMPQGLFHSNLHRYDQPSLFRRLEEAPRRRSLRIYFGDFPLSLLLADRRTARAALNYRDLEAFFGDAVGVATEFPDFTLIEPCYLNEPNDDHPPHSTDAGEELIARVYEAIRVNSELWASTLLVVIYDEHGGFYDHREPPAATPPDAPGDAEYDFTRLGVRVPALLISPWITSQVVHTECDHTALLRSLQVRWGLGALGARVAAAPDILASVLLASAPREDTPARLLRPPGAARAAASRRPRPRPTARAILNDNEQAIVAFSQFLDAQTPAPPLQKVRRMKQAMRSADDARQVAEARARHFLSSRGAPTRAR